MDHEKIIKKEDKINYKKSFLLNPRGELVLTASELYHQDRKNKKLVSIPIKDIVNVRTAKSVGSMNEMFVTYSAEGKEKVARFQQFSFFNSQLAIGNLSRIQANYFTAWQEAIEDLRGGKSHGDQGYHDLEKLASLKEKGVITEEEFKAKKKQLLGL